MTLRPDQARRYARHVRLPGVGEAGQARLLAARVGVPDASGARAAAVLYLAAAGVGTLVVTDRRPVAPGDGVLYEAADEGRPRVEAARARVAALNPDVTVREAGEVNRVLELPPATRGEGPTDPIEALERGAAAPAG